MRIIIAKEEINWGDGDYNNILLLPYRGKNSIHFLYLLVTALILSCPLPAPLWSNQLQKSFGLAHVCPLQPECKSWCAPLSPRQKNKKNKVLACMPHVPHPEEFYFI